MVRITLLIQPQRLHWTVFLAISLELGCGYSAHALAVLDGPYDLDAVAKVLAGLIRKGGHLREVLAELEARLLATRLLFSLAPELGVDGIIEHRLWLP